MWLFKKKYPRRDIIKDGIAELKAFREIGETFNYLGRSCIVTGHSQVFPFVGVVPLLEFDYCDNYGVLHSCTALLAELPALMNQQKPNS